MLSSSKEALAEPNVHFRLLYWGVRVFVTLSVVALFTEL
jgi:hypothetical protein